jgi:hypothetical protein
MKRAYVLVERQTDVDFLRRVLPPELTKDVEIVPTGSSDGAPSLARSLLVRRNRPVAVFMDAYSLAPAVIEERRGETEELIRLAAAHVPVKVVVAVPELEAYFFAVPEVIERVLGEKVPSEWVLFGQRDPRGILDELSRRANRKWDLEQAIQALDAHDIERLRAAPAVSELSAFLRDVLEEGKAA